MDVLKDVCAVITQHPCDDCRECEPWEANMHTRCDAWTVAYARARRG